MPVVRGLHNATRWTSFLFKLRGWCQREVSVALGLPPFPWLAAASPCLFGGSTPAQAHAEGFGLLPSMASCGQLSVFAFSRSTFLPSAGARARNTCIGRSGARASHPKPATISSGLLDVEEAFLSWCADLLVPFFRTAFLQILLLLWLLIWSALPIRRSVRAQLASPLGSSLSLGILTPLGNVARTDFASKRARPSLRNKARPHAWGPFGWFACSLLGFSTCPVQVWAAPDNIPGPAEGFGPHFTRPPIPAASEGSMPEASPVRTPDVEEQVSPDDAQPAFADLRAIVAQTQAESLHEAYDDVHAALDQVAAAGIEVEPQSEVPVTDFRDQHVSRSGMDMLIPVVLTAPGYRLETLWLQTAIPATVPELEAELRAVSPSLFDEIGDVLTPVHPQVEIGQACFVVTPPWFGEANLAAVAVDARAVQGRVFSIVVSFPTSVEEIDRLVGLASVAEHDVYAAGARDPLVPGTPLELQSGALVKLLPPRRAPLWAPPLPFALWHTSLWPKGASPPVSGHATAALILHRTGKYMMAHFGDDDWANLRSLASLVGVPLAELCVEAASNEELTPYVYHGIAIRCVLAAFPRQAQAAGYGQRYVVFLDSRPLGFDVNFLLLDTLHITQGQLLQYLQQPPPRGWRLAVRGGQKQGDGYDFVQGEVLTLCFLRKHVIAQEDAESEEAFSSDPEDSEPDEFPDDHSARTRTRSRTPNRSSPHGQPHDPSSDHSYQGFESPQAVFLADCGPGKLPARLDSQLRQGSKSCNLLSSQGTEHGRKNKLHSLLAQTRQWISRQVDCSLGCVHQWSSPLFGFKTPDFSGSRISLARGQPSAGYPTLPPLREAGDRSPNRPEGPTLLVEPPALLPAQPIVLFQVYFLVLVEGYRPELIPLALRSPASIESAMQALHTHRLPFPKRVFPRIIPMPFQTCRHFAVFLAAPDWDKHDVEVLFDCRALGGQLHAKCMPRLATFQHLRDAAGIVRWLPVDIWIEPFVQPLPITGAVQLQEGFLIVFQPQGQCAPTLHDLTAMLRDPQGWDQLADLPFLFDPAVWIMTDDGPFRHVVDQQRQRMSRTDMAQALGHDPTRTIAVPPEPPIRDYNFLGACMSAVLVVSQLLPNLRGPSHGPCVVFLDQRPLLAGLTWCLVPDGLLSIASVFANLPRPCPSGHRVQVTGAYPLPGTDTYRVADGTKLIFEFVPSQLAAASDDSDMSGDDSSVNSPRNTLGSDSEADSSQSDEASPEAAPPAGPPPPHPLRFHGAAWLLILAALCPTPAQGAAPSSSEATVSFADLAIVWHAFRHAFTVACSAAVVLERFVFVSSLLSGVACKLLFEPSNPSIGDSDLLASLRHATRLLGIEWPFMPSDMAAWFLQDVPGEFNQNTPETSRSVQFAVLKPDYCPELVTLELPIPCTLREAEDALQTARATENFIRFPHVHAVFPQSLVGQALFVAAPRWSPQAVVVCLNTAAVDGRVFAVYAPAYAEYEELCEMAALPPQAGYHVFVGGDDQAMLPGTLAHLVPGMQIAFVEEGSLPDPGAPLPLLLTLEDAWLHQAAFPEPQVREAYCLVSRQQGHVLHVEDHSNPLRFRERLAASIGLRLSSFHILASDPPLRNLAISGVRCTLLATCDCPDGIEHCRGRFFDLRPIQEGMRFACDAARLPNLDEVLAVFARDAPAGWQPRITIDGRAGDSYVDAQPGAILTVDYVPVMPADVDIATSRIPNTANGALLPIAHAANEAPDPVPEPQASRSSAASSSHVPSAANPAAASSGSATGSGLGSDADEVATAGSTNAEATPCCASPLAFLIFTPDYKPEGIATGLMPPVSQSGLFATIAHLRSATDHRRSPNLLPVHPQPSGLPATLVALPSWPKENILILIDSRIGQRRTFAICVPNFFTKDDAAFMAGVAPEDAYDVYHKDVPWPIPAGYWIYPADGDLLVIQPAGRAPAPFVSLRQILDGDAPPGPMPLDAWNSDKVWVLSDGIHVAVSVPTDEFALNSAQTADMLGLRPGSFQLVPVQPEIIDHAYRGTPSRRVLIAKQTQEPTAADNARYVPYVLDLRPIHLYLSSALAYDGVIDVANICNRVRVRCPTGFHVRLYGGAFTGAAGNHYRQVLPGEILAVEYHPDFVRDVVSELDPASYTPSAAPGGGSDSGHSGPNMSAASSGSGHRHGNAGSVLPGDTGGSTQHSSPGHGVSWPRHFVQASARKWVLVSLHHAIADGYTKPTSAAERFCTIPLAVSFIRGLVPPCPMALNATAHAASHMSICGHLVPLSLFVFAVCAAGFWCLPIFKPLSDLLAILMILLVALPHTLRLRPRVIVALTLLGLIVRAAAAPIWDGNSESPLHQPVSCVGTPLSVVPALLAVGSDRTIPHQLCRRPLPTPCRAKAPLGSAVFSDVVVDDRALPEDLETLLEASCRRQGGYPLYLAATLLEALERHFGSTCSSARAIGLTGSYKPVLHLQLHLPPAFLDVAHEATSHLGQCARLSVVPFPWPALPSCVSPEDEARLGSTPLGFTFITLRRLLRASPAFLDFRDFQAACPAVASIPGIYSPAVLPALTAQYGQSLLVYTDGSFTPLPQGRAKAGWAVIIIDPVAGTFAAAFGPVLAFPGEPLQLSPYQAECYALMSAALVTTVAFHNRPCTFLSDCTSAIGAAEGSMAYASGGFAQAMASSHHFRRQTCGQPDLYLHISGHAGVVGNELADRASKMGSDGPEIFCGLLLEPTEVKFWLGSGGQKLPWAATTIRSLSGDSTLPPINALDMGGNQNHSTLQPRELLAPFVPEGVFDAPVPEPVVLQVDNGMSPPLLAFSLRLVTYNVLSLGKPADAAPNVEVTQGLAYQPARAALLAEQLHEHGIHVAFLQETRAEEGSSRVGAFLRYASGANRGQYGTEIWFRDQYSRLGQEAQRQCANQFDRTSVVVVYSDPRRMFVRFTGQSLSILFVALHGPHRATEKPVIVTWWRETAHLLDQHSRQSYLVLGGDCNASLGSITSGHVQGLGAEDEDLAGEYLHLIARTYSLCAPATFADFHSGPTHTYIQKHGRYLCRPDFVLVPQDWLQSDVHSWTEPAIQAAHSTPDHIAACLAIGFRSVPRSSTPRLVRRKISAAAVLDPGNRGAIADIFESAPVIPWDVSVHAHAAILTKHVQDGLQRLSANQGPKPHHPYLQAGTWQLQRDVSETRRRLHRLTVMMANSELAAGFTAWARAKPLREVNRQGRVWLLRAQAVRHTLHSRLVEQCKLLRKACRRDRDTYIERLAETISTAPSKEAFAAYHRILAHKRKKPFTIDPLPKILELDGTVCLDSDAMKRRWRQHFASLEGGQDVSFQLIADQAAEACSSTPAPHPDSIHEVPNLPNLCRVLAATKTGKAPGMDSLPPELNRLYASATARVLFPVLLKQVWRGSEPAGFKGGQAIVMYKGKGATAHCASYRSILLMQTWAKSLHQALRPAVRAVFEHTAPVLQLGGRKGCSVTLGSHILRGTLRHAHARNTPAFVLFADISAAFYSALVQLVAQSDSTTSLEGIEAALHGLSLPSEVLAELRQHMRAPSALAQKGATPWLEQTAAHLGQHNWFLIAGDKVPISTGRGTRPGSSWADILFALLMPKVLAKRDELLQLRDLHSRKPVFDWDGVVTLEPCTDPTESLVVDEVVWADDIAIPRLCPAIHQLSRLLRAETTALTEAFFAFGFRLAFGEHKTAAVVSVCGAHSRAVKRDLYGHEGLRGQLPILFEHLPAMRLPLPSKYKHLGVLQTPTGSILEEIRHRAAVARSAFHEARRKVYKSAAISLSRKATLLTTTVLPKLLQGAGAWPPLNKREAQAFSGTVWGFYRGILGVKRQADQRITASTCFSILQVPDPDVVLRLTRLSYLAQLVRSGPPVLWAAIRVDRPYADMLQSDLRWLFAWTWQTLPLRDPTLYWDDWRDLMQTSPNRFKGLCKRAKALTICQHTVKAALDNLHTALSDLSGRQTVVNGVFHAVHTEMCLPCKRSFPSRVSWAGHAARCHGYRSRSFLLPEDRVCRTCAKAYASIGRLRRHLISAPRCLAEWGGFEPTAHARQYQPHALAPPEAVPGVMVAPPAMDFSDMISHTLLTELNELDLCDEDTVWETIESHIEPLQTLRATVSAWRTQGDASPWRVETADNMLLLLDPDVLAESRQPPSDRAASVFTDSPTWAPLSPLPLVSAGDLLVKQLPEPPQCTLPPDGPCSLAVRSASAYAHWLEAACDACAGCAREAATRPILLSCRGLRTALGPAAQWLTDCGFRFTAEGLSSAF